MTVRLHDTPRGMNFARYCIALAMAKNDPSLAARVAEHRWGGLSPAAKSLENFHMIKRDLARFVEAKAAVGAGSLGDAQFLGPLNDFATMTAEFLAAVRERSIVGRMVGLRRVPLNVRVLTQDVGAVAQWVKAGKAKPLTDGVISGPNTLSPLTVVALTVVTDELIKHSSPEAEEIIRNDLINATAARLDQSFVDPDNAGVADEEPASITNGVTPVTDGDLFVGLQLLLDDFEGDLGRAFFIGSPRALIRVNIVAKQKDCGARGGEALGIPAIASRNVPEGILILADAGGIALGQSGVEVSTSRQATVEMEDASSTTQDSTAPTPSQVVSLWQTNCTGIRVEQFCNWHPRSDAVSFLRYASEESGSSGT